MDSKQKYEKLINILKEFGSVMIAYSGGVDSTFLVKVAYDVLGKNAAAVTATSSTYPIREFNEACAYAKELGIEHIVINSEELDIEGFAENPINRCYYCKKELFSRIAKIAEEKGFAYVADGSNFDDTGDFRPGLTAAAELGVVSPLKLAGMTKEDIRCISKELNLPTWNKPAFACLSSRFPYGTRITPERLNMVEKAEDYLLGLGFQQVRVRYHNEIARIEVAPSERSKFFDENLMDKVAEKFREFGFVYSALELSGYRTGSMNEILKKKGEI